MHKWQHCWLTVLQGDEHESNAARSHTFAIRREIDIEASAHGVCLAAARLSPKDANKGVIT
jgi:hypothetical protein